MRRAVGRLLLVLVAVSGLLALFSGAAHAIITYNHCEPLRRW